jgi:hypothetical protein
LQQRPLSLLLSFSFFFFLTHIAAAATTVMGEGLTRDDLER